MPSLTPLHWNLLPSLWGATSTLSQISSFPFLPLVVTTGVCPPKQNCLLWPIFEPHKNAITLNVLLCNLLFPSDIINFIYIYMRFINVDSCSCSSFIPPIDISVNGYTTIYLFSCQYTFLVFLGRIRFPPRQKLPLPIFLTCLSTKPQNFLQGIYLVRLCKFMRHAVFTDYCIFPKQKYQCIFPKAVFWASHWSLPS